MNLISICISIYNYIEKEKASQNQSKIWMKMARSNKKTPKRTHQKKYIWHLMCSSFSVHFRFFVVFFFFFFFFWAHFTQQNDMDQSHNPYDMRCTYSWIVIHSQFKQWCYTMMMMLFKWWRGRERERKKWTFNNNEMKWNFVVFFS